MSLERRDHPALKLLTVSLPMSPLSALERDFFRRTPVGGVCLFRGSLSAPEQGGTLAGVSELLLELHDLLGPETLVSIDQEGGSVLRLPQLPVSPGGRVLGEANDPESTYRISRGMARGLRALGINVNLAPLLDVNSNPLNPVIGERAFGSTLERVIQHGLAFLRGHRDGGVLAVGKHFPGHGDTSVDSHLALPMLERSWEELEALELAPFRTAAQEGLLEALMTAHIVFPKLDPQPVTISPTLLPQLLARLPDGRGGEAWNGLVYSDGLNMKAILDAHPQAEAARLCIEAGCDQALLYTRELLDQESFVRDFLEALPSEAAIERGLERHARAVARFPFKKPDPDALERVLGDHELHADIAWVAGAALRVEGAAHPFARGTRLLALLPTLSDGGAASDRIPIAARLTPLLRSAFPQVQVLEYGTTLPEVTAALEGAGAVLLVTAQRLEMRLERELARVVAGHPHALHVNLWNPELRLEGLPTLLSFGFHDASLRAVVERLLREVQG